MKLIKSDRKVIYNFTKDFYYIFSILCTITKDDKWISSSLRVKKDICKNSLLQKGV